METFLYSPLYTVWGFDKMESGRISSIPIYGYTDIWITGVIFLRAFSYFTTICFSLLCLKRDYI